MSKYFLELFWVFVLLWRGSSLERVANGGYMRSFCSRKFLFVAISFLFVVSPLIGCGPSLRSSIGVPEIHIKQVKAPPSDNMSYLFVDEFSDHREPKALVHRDKKDVMPAGDVVPAVTKALKQALEAKGFQLSESAPVIISGEVREWVADVTGSLPTKVSAKAAVFIEVLDPANKRVYSGVYKGFASVEEASVSEEDVQRGLASAMEEAVLQVASDKQLVNLLSSF